MGEVAETLVPIDLRLRLMFFGLECALGVSLSVPECERVFRNAADDQVAEKAYEFHQSRRLRVSGRVDEYEPESLRLRVEGGSGVKDVLRRVAAGAADHSGRLR